MKRISFFALKDDLLPVLEAVEAKRPVRYTRGGPIPTEAYEQFMHGRDIPELGVATGNQYVACNRFLVTDADTPIQVQPVRIGNCRFKISQLGNEDSVVLVPGGVWSEDILIYGEVGTVSDSPPAQALMRAFNAPIRKRFKRIAWAWVGPLAEEMLMAGKRLTQAVYGRGRDLPAPEG